MVIRFCRSLSRELVPVDCQTTDCKLINLQGEISAGSPSWTSNSMENYMELLHSFSHMYQSNIIPYISKFNFKELRKLAFCLGCSRTKQFWRWSSASGRTKQKSTWPVESAKQKCLQSIVETQDGTDFL